MYFRKAKGGLLTLVAKPGVQQEQGDLSVEVGMIKRKWGSS